MSNSTIGIKIANGEYYPILTEDSKVRRRLVLTTVNDEQGSVQIDLYRGEGDTIEQASYIGSLIIEDIEEAPQGDPEIELVLGIDEEGNLNATASDGKSGERQSLSVGLNSLEGMDTYEIPDFELHTDGGEPQAPFDDNFFGDIETPSTVVDEESLVPEDDFSAGGFSGFHDLDEEKPREKRKVNPLLLIGFILAGLAIAALILLLLLRSFPGEPIPPLNAQGEAPQEAPESPEPAPEPVAEKPVTPPPAEKPAPPETEPVAPAVSETPVETQEPPRTVIYHIKRGDTLWDLSNSFYRTPWLYRKIARDNAIENPDLIYAGENLNILEQ